MPRPFIPLILGTARQGRQSEKVAKYLFEHLKRFDFDTELIDVRDYLPAAQTIPPWEENEATRPWRKIVARASAFIIVAPEYNHGYPGELKLLLDQELDAYDDKYVLMCGVSSGRFGGARLLDHILPVFNELGLINVAYPLYFGNVEKLFAQELDAIDAEYRKRIDKSIGELLNYIGQQHSS